MMSDEAYIHPLTLFGLQLDLLIGSCFGEWGRRNGKIVSGYTFNPAAKYVYLDTGRPGDILSQKVKDRPSPPGTNMNLFPYEVDRATLCPGCSGMGERTYPTSAGRSMLPGGMTITADVCDQCDGLGTL